MRRDRLFTRFVLLSTLVVLGDEVRGPPVAGQGEVHGLEEPRLQGAVPHALDRSKMARTVWRVSDSPAGLSGRYRFTRAKRNANPLT